MTLHVKKILPKCFSGTVTKSGKTSLTLGPIPNIDFRSYDKIPLLPKLAGIGQSVSELSGQLKICAGHPRP